LFWMCGVHMDDFLNSLAREAYVSKVEVDMAEIRKQLSTLMPKFKE
jgi:hypothetical protein